MDLIERDEALATMEALLANILNGRGCVAVVSGTVATGKSRLLDTFAQGTAERGALSIAATGSPMEQALPLGVLGQLIDEAPLTEEERARAVALLREGALGDLSSDRLEPPHAQVVHALCTVLVELSERYPLVIMVDDAHYADRLSLLCLAYLSRRVRLARVMLVLSYSEHVRESEAGTFSWTQLFPGPRCHIIQLHPLSPAAVHSLVAARVGAEPAERHAEDWHAYGAGNPLLLSALLAESSEGRPVPGDRYGRAVLECLHRGEAELLCAARGLAVLDEVDSLHRLLGVERTRLDRALRSLTTVGVLDSGRFRHEAGRLAVLAELKPAKRMDLHRRAAELCHEDGAPTEVIAEHLLHSGPLDAPWVVPVLTEAAGDALREGRVKPAIEYLRLAWHAACDERERTRLAIMLMRAEWRINPAAPARRLTDLVETMQRGWLSGSDAVVLARALLWHGKLDDAREVFDHLTGSDVAHDPETALELAIARSWLRSTYPSIELPPDETPTPSTHVPLTAIHRLESSVALTDVIVTGPRSDAIAAAERVLRVCHLDEMTMDTVESALLALTYGGLAGRAAPLCELFLAEAAALQAPSRLARLAAIRAEIAIRQGDLRTAVRQASNALELVPVSSWGATVGGPLCSLVIALTAMGRYETARDLLDRPVLDAMFETRYGLHYLYARGRYSLAIGDPAAALADFRRCGELMEQWNLQAPDLFPWRADAADALLRLGDQEQARFLIEDQLVRFGCSSTRVHGISMRLFAATSEMRHRPNLLRRAVDLLQSSGDEFELARALFDLAEAYDKLGERRRAGMIMVRARTVAAECGAALDSTVQAVEVEAPAARELGDEAAVLSEAERRVAVLAAAGHTNREIAGQLYLTVSTVEQHLTRTYRKLNIGGRSDLPASLSF
ncbi:AAA family ATPase [Nonomuraea sp. K274]|uniref:AAA family ATPase n=1 Tax=Nonomuraea cypriaca TaxID=1187855 RepID=A0A931AIE9_9ACTN|nr:LuxR family transcriptional regulator [Nonomuraea cypriaca]MBF8190919.1 AAA family ATPase [Nonomuraea cypriaca]